MASSIPTTSLAATQDPTTLTISTTTVPTPVPSPSQLLIRLSHTGLCAADLHLARRALPYLLPRPGITTLGHEGVGTIAALPTSPSPSPSPTPWKLGDRVGIRWLHSICATCALCRTGSENLCAARRITGRDVPGAFAQFALADAAYTVRIPEAVSAAHAAPVLCAGVTVYKALRVAGLPRGSWVAVSGAGGGLGHLAVQYAVAMGYRVVGLDVGKRGICLELGAEAYVEVGAGRGEGGNVVEEVLGLTDGGAHGVLVCASSSAAYADGVGYLRKAGTLVCIGAPAKSATMPVSPEDFIARGIKIIGTSTGTIADTEEALAYVARGEVTPRIEIRELDEVEQALADLESGRVEGRIVIRIP